MTVNSAPPDEIDAVGRGRRPPTLWLVVGAAAVLVLIVLGVVALSGSEGSDSESGNSLMGTQTAQVDDIAVAVTPQTFQSGRLVFDVILDTHSGSLDADLESSTLTVDGSSTGPATWSGAAPGGHHREGTLTYDVVGSPAQFTLTIIGLPTPIEMTWR